MKMESRWTRTSPRSSPRGVPGWRLRGLRALQTAIHALQLEPWNILIVSASVFEQPAALPVHIWVPRRSTPPPGRRRGEAREPRPERDRDRGDGDGTGSAWGTSFHAMRRNFDITYVVMNNQDLRSHDRPGEPNVGEGDETKSTPIEGVIETRSTRSRSPLPRARRMSPGPSAGNVKRWPNS